MNCIQTIQHWLWIILLGVIVFLTDSVNAEGRLPEAFKEVPQRVAEFQEPVSGENSTEMINTLIRENIIPLGKFIFIGVGLLFFAVYAYRIALGTGSDDQLSTQRSNLLFAVLGFLIIALAEEVVAITNPIRSGDTSKLVEQSQLDSVVQTIVNVLELSVGTIAIAVVFYGGIQMVTANGDEEKVSIGKRMLLYGFLGFVFIMLAHPLVTEIFYPAMGSQNLGNAQAQNLVQQGLGILQFVLQFLAILIFLAFLYSGFMFLFGGLNEDAQGKAKQSLLWTILGFIIVIISYSLVLFFIPE